MKDHTQQQFTLEIAKVSKFRLFCNEKWYEHKDEIFVWTGQAEPDYDSVYYFNKHRWLLKSMFKQQQKES